MERDRCAVVGLFQAGYKPKEISKMLKMPRGRRMFVVRAIKVGLSYGLLFFIKNLPKVLFNHFRITKGVLNNNFDF